MRNYFCGWYFKCQSDDQTLAVIPAIHKSGKKKTCSIQIITDDGALMLSVADIPMGVFHFTGIIAVIHWKGAEYRLATYLGAGVVRLKDGEIIIRQGHMLLAVKLLEKHTNPLFAPIGGAMSRTVHESASCRAAYSFWIGHRRLFSFETSRASFEYEYPY